jgi:hypothetical protein
MQLKNKIVAGALIVLALGGVGAGVASAGSPTGGAAGSSTAAVVDTPEPGDTADPAGAVDTAEAFDRADPAGSVDTDNRQQGNQRGRTP